VQERERVCVCVCERERERERRERETLPQNALEAESKRLLVYFLTGFEVISQSMSQYAAGMALSSCLRGVKTERTAKAKTFGKSPPSSGFRAQRDGMHGKSKGNHHCKTLVFLHLARI
jgi:hypothetical protein